MLRYKKLFWNNCKHYNYLCLPFLIVAATTSSHTTTFRSNITDNDALVKSPELEFEDLSPSCPSWKTGLLNSLKAHQGIYSANFISLSSICSSNSLQPKNRIVVFRGFHNNAILFVTDSRNKKCVEFHTNPRTEIVWYFPNTREQYR